MAVLHQPRTGHRHVLITRSLVGRSPMAQLRISDRKVSNEHAVIWFDDEGWKIRDLGSRNGTWVAGRRLEPQQTTTLIRGAELRFGGTEHVWTMAEDGPPGAIATCAGTGAVVVAQDGMLLVPDADEPLLCAYSDGMGGWIYEIGDQSHAAREVVEVAVGTEVWTLVLPFESARTWGVGASPASAAAVLRFAVSSDEEHVEITVSQGGEDIVLEPRTHAYFLLTLARQRIADATEGLSRAEQGWLDAEELCRMLRLSRATLNQRVFRARQQLAATGRIAAAEVVERRPHTGQIRLGVAGVEVTGLG